MELIDSYYVVVLTRVKLRLSPEHPLGKTQTMSDSEHDASILGKRTRNGPDADISEDAEMDPPSAIQEDDGESDDDVGPMPMPESAADNAVTKKKRKGALRFIVRGLIRWC